MTTLLHISPQVFLGWNNKIHVISSAYYPQVLTVFEITQKRMHEMQMNTFSNSALQSEQNLKT